VTLVVALQGQDGLVLAADSRSHQGDPQTGYVVTDHERKFVELTRYGGVGIVGTADLGIKIVEDLTTAVAPVWDQPAIDEVAEQTRVLACERYAWWFGSDMAHHPGLMFVLCGYQGQASGEPLPRLYALLSSYAFVPLPSTVGHATGGYNLFAAYYLNRLYSSAMTVAQLPRLAAHLIYETSRTDPSRVGLPIQMATITPQDGVQMMDAHAIVQLVRNNKGQMKRLKQSFLKEGSYGSTAVRAHR
jgi:predicted proteasome-type protease